MKDIDNVPSIERITVKSLAHELADIVNLKKGVPYTLFQILRNPGKAIKNYLYHDRTKMVNSFKLLVLVVTLSTFLSLKFGVAEQIFTTSASSGVNSSGAHSNQQFSPEVLDQFRETFMHYLSWMSFLLVPFLGGITYLFFRPSGLNLAEQITAQAFMISFITATSVVLMPLAVYNFTVYNILFMSVSVGYHMWFCFFIDKRQGKVKTFFMGLLSYVMAYAIYIIVVSTAVGISIAYGENPY